jgi:Uma2 family endonuclease
MTQARKVSNFLDQESEDEQLVEMPSLEFSLEHGAIGIRLERYLDTYVEEQGLGLVCNSRTTYRFVGERPTRFPDLSFVSRDRLPDRIDQNANFAPDLAVEVLSKGDDASEVDKKI